MGREIGGQNVRTFDASKVIVALNLAIEEQQHDEYARGMTTDSALLAEWKELRDCLRKGQAVMIQ